jgi:peroxiredoxin
MAQPVPVGAVAPDFSLPSTPDQRVSFAFYPADFSPVCGDQMTLYNQLRGEFADLDAQLFGISVDGAWCHCAFASDRKLHFPLLADFEPKGEVAKRYGVYRDVEGVSDRALFLIDAEGKVAWSYVSPIGVNPGADGLLSALERLKGVA